MKKLVFALFVGSCLFAHAETKPYVSIYAGGSGLQETDYDYGNGAATGSFGYDVTPVFGVAIGTSIAEWPIRVEFEYSYRKSDLDRIKTSSGGVVTDEKGNIKSQMFMGNIYYDFTDVDSPVIPYVFVGAGVVKVDMTPPWGSMGLVKDSDTVFAGQVGLGASWALTDHILFDVKGRVIMSDKTEYKDTNMEGDNLIYAEVLAGIRLQF